MKTCLATALARLQNIMQTAKARYASLLRLATDKILLNIFISFGSLDTFGPCL